MNTAFTDTMNEADLLDAVLEYAELRGWLTYHARPARTRDGWRTPAQGNGARGFPDLIMCRRDRLVIAELKSARGRLTDSQRDWLDALAAVPDIETYTWRPDEWHDGTIDEGYWRETHPDAVVTPRRSADPMPNTGQSFRGHSRRETAQSPRLYTTTPPGSGCVAMLRRV